ncbi:MAG: Mu transposase C-terminal domain-containing protein, partial [Bauldia litoralis]
MPDRSEDDPLSDSLTSFSEDRRVEAMRRFTLLRPHLIEGVSLAETARAAGRPLRTLQHWLARYRRNGLVGLARSRRSDAGRRRVPSELVGLVEGLALQKPRLSAAAIPRRVTAIAKERDWPVPSYAAIHAMVRDVDPALMTLAHEGPTAYRDRYELIHRHRAERPNAIWQADHTQLDLLVLDSDGTPVRPWLTVVLDDYSRAAAGYTVFTGAPSAVQTALALRQAIWRKDTPTWPVCGIPDVLYTDHGSDFTSRHIEQVAVDLRVELVFSAVGRPQGRGKIERFFGTVDTEVLPELPGALSNGKPASPPRLSLAELDAAIKAFITGTYNARIHGEIGQSPRDAWVAEGWLPRMPDSLEALDLLLIPAAQSRLVRRDGIRFQGLRYADLTLAAYVGQNVSIRYDPRDITEIRVYYRDRFLCRAVSAEHAHRKISLKDIQQARVARRKALRSEIAVRTRKVTEFLPHPE